MYKAVAGIDNFRAKQIVNSNENINVLFEGRPVWIEGVSDNGVAEVIAMSGSRVRREVPVNRLIEKT